MCFLVNIQGNPKSVATKNSDLKKKKSQFLLFFFHEITDSFAKVNLTLNQKHVLKALEDC